MGNARAVSHRHCRLFTNAVVQALALAWDDFGQSAFGVEEPASVLPEVVRTGSEVGVDEDDCSPTRARARCAAGSRGSGGQHAHRRLPKSRRRRAAGVADHDAGPSRAWRCAPLANPRARPARRPSAAKAGLRPCPGQRLARESSSASISQLSRLRPTRGASWSATGARGSRVDPAIWKQARDYRHRDNDLPSGCGGSLSMPEAVRCAGVVVRV